MLEKPAEMLLAHPEINISYCFSWANETWSRRWTGEEKEILIRQSYGNKEDWENHFQYLLPFFKDSRYIRFENKVVLILYRAFEIPQCEEMISYWNYRMKEEGLPELYIIETLNSTQKVGCLKISSAYVEFEPMYTVYQDMNFFVRGYRYLFHHLKLSNIVGYDCLSYDFVWKRILRRCNDGPKKIFLGAFPCWDNTARKGRNGLVIKNSTPQKFKKYFSKQYERSVQRGNEFIFVNAWNEWGEGAYLEPDEKYGYQYLEAIKYVKNEIIKR